MKGPAAASAWAFARVALRGGDAGVNGESREIRSIPLLSDNTCGGTFNQSVKNVNRHEMHLNE